MITPANRPYVPEAPAPHEPHAMQGAPAARDARQAHDTRPVSPHAALIPGWSEMAVWQPDAPVTRSATEPGSSTRGFLGILTKLLVR